MNENRFHFQFDVSDELPKGLCRKCCENLDRAYKFKIQCEYTEQKFRDALADCHLEKYPAYLPTTTTITTVEEVAAGGSDDDHNVSNADDTNRASKTDCDGKAFDVLDESIQSQLVVEEDDEIYEEETSSVILKEEHLFDAEVESFSQASPTNSQIVAEIDDDSEANIDYGDVERLEDDEQYGDMGEVMEGEIGEFTATDDIEYIYDETEIEYLDSDTKNEKVWRKADAKAKTKVNKANSRNPETDKFHCDTCGAPFEKYNDLNEHKKTHGNKRYQCPTCSRWFSKKYHMKNHQTIHLNQKLFACALCTKKYTNQGNLDRHVRVFHHNEKQVNIVLDLLSFIEQ